MAVVKPEIKTTEYEMFSRYRETGDIALRDEIVSSYIYIAEILSRKFINRGVEYDDIFQVASRAASAPPSPTGMRSTMKNGGRSACHHALTS